MPHYRQAQMCSPYVKYRRCTTYPTISIVHIVNRYTCLLYCQVGSMLYMQCMHTAQMFNIYRKETNWYECNKNTPKEDKRYQRDISRKKRKSAVNV